MISWLGENWGNLLSAIGFALTVWTLIRAGKAVKAAEGARRASEAAKLAVNRQGAVHALADSAQMVSELMTLVEVASFQTASLRARDVSRALQYILDRWDVELVDVIVQLAEAQSQVDSVSRKLRSVQAGPKDVPHLLGVLQKVSHAITGAQGTAEKKGLENA